MAACYAAERAAARVNATWRKFDGRISSWVALPSALLLVGTPSVEVTRVMALDRCSQVLSSRGAQTSEAEGTTFLLYDHRNPSVVQRRRSPSAMRVGDANRQSGGRVPLIFCAAHRGGCPFTCRSCCVRGGCSAPITSPTLISIKLGPRDGAPAHTPRRAPLAASPAVLYSADVIVNLQHAPLPRWLDCGDQLVTCQLSVASCCCGAVWTLCLCVNRRQRSSHVLSYGRHVPCFFFSGVARCVGLAHTPRSVR